MENVNKLNTKSKKNHETYNCSYTNLENQENIQSKNQGIKVEIRLLMWQKLQDSERTLCTIICQEII